MEAALEPQVFIGGLECLTGAAQEMINYVSFRDVNEM